MQLHMDSPTVRLHSTTEEPFEEPASEKESAFSLTRSSGLFEEMLSLQVTQFLQAFETVVSVNVLSEESEREGR